MSAVEMPRYERPLGLTLLVAGQNAGFWAVDGPFVLRWRGRDIVVPDRFVTDGPSIPRPMRALIPVRGRLWPASVIHDHLYWHQPKGWTRAQVDRLFRLALASSGVGPLTRWAMWLAVRAGGWVLWYDDKGA
jgi:hypothetical protein